jgi:hypothetical protein
VENPSGSRGLTANTRWARLVGWVAFSAVTAGWWWGRGWSKGDISPSVWIAICGLAILAELLLAWRTLPKHIVSRARIGIDWVAAFLSYACACCLVAAADSPVQLACVAWLIGLVAHRDYSSASPRRLVPELAAIWAALAVGCTFRSERTSVFAFVLLGAIATALQLSHRGGNRVELHEQPQPDKQDGTQTQEADPSWAQHDSILHDLSNAMTASLFMVRDLSRALDKGTDPGLHRARRLSQELVGELSQIGEHIVSSRQSVRLQPILGSSITLIDPVRRCVEIIERLYPDVHCRVECDAAASVATISTIGGAATLKRILENLLINACQAERSAAEKLVWCQIAVAETSVLLTVEDNGLGFPKVVLDTFPSPMVSTKAQGTGIGLYSCHQMIKRDGGTLAISNTGATGARVTISWPKSDATRILGDATNETEISISGTRPRANPSERVVVTAEKR